MLRVTANAKSHRSSYGFCHVLDNIGNHDYNSWLSELQTGSKQPPQGILCVPKSLGPLRRPSPSPTGVSKTHYMHACALSHTTFQNFGDLINH